MAMTGQQFELDDLNEPPLFIPDDGSAKRKTSDGGKTLAPRRLQEFAELIIRDQELVP
jgi:hypothetical protein